MRRQIVLAISVLTMLALAVPSARADDSRGTEFWLAFMSNHTNNAELTLFITSETDATGTVEVPGIAFSEAFAVSAGALTSVILPTGAQLLTSDSGTVVDKGVHVTSDAEVTVYGLSRIPFTTDAYLGLPTDILGTEYLSISYTPSFGGSGFAVAGVEDDTTVTMTLVADAVGETAGVPFDVVLDAGEVYQVLAGASDLTGSSITSDKPVAVFGGNECVNIPPDAVACDHIIEQLTPVSTWGTSFVTAPLATRLNGDTFRIMAANDATVVSINGTEVATLDKGAFHEQLIDGPATVTATGPIAVMQYSNGTSFDGVTSDPFMMTIPAEEQFLSAYTVSTPASGFATNFVNVVAPDSSIGSVTLDGAAIDAADFSPIGTSGFYYTQQAVEVGAHRLEGPEPFGVYAYGFDNADSYGYPGGMAVAQIASVETITLSPISQLALVGDEACVVAQALDVDDAPVPGVRIDLDTTGAHPGTTFAFADENGEAQFCFTGAVAGVDTHVASVGNLESDLAQVNWVAEIVLTIDPPEQDLEVGTEGCVTITVIGDGNLLADIEVTLTATELVEQTSVLVTDGNGEADYCVTSPDPGTVTIVASFGIVQTPEATITWSETIPETGASTLALFLLGAGFTGSGTALVHAADRRLRRED